MHGPHLNLMRGIMLRARRIAASLDELQTIEMTQSGGGNCLEA
jgi:hypothetical protein